MKTLIELYDERPIENVLATEVFRPERTVYLCPQEVINDKRIQTKLREYFAHRGIETELVFLESSIYNTDKLQKQLRSVAEQYGDCMIDITGGTDDALFACGMLCAEYNIPTFTYSRKSNCFYNIKNAPFADKLICTVKHKVEDCFLMAGGAMRSGRVDNSLLTRYMNDIDPFFRVYLKHRINWTRIVSYIQKTSQRSEDQPVKLEISGAYSVKSNRSTVNAPDECLYDLEAIGFLSDVSISRERVEYAFKDEQMRTWLRDIGSVLELYVYKTCLDTGIFNDVFTSAVVDWEGGFLRDNVTNEIDVMAMYGILPVFISCKTCSISTEALNELAVLRDRFGGFIAKAAIVTAQKCRSITRHRASELGIEIIDLDDLKSGRTAKHIKNMILRGTEK